MFERRRSRRFVPSLGFDSLERRLCLDGSADGTGDPVYDAELASVGGDPNFDQADENAIGGETAVAMPGVHIAANMAPTKQDLIDVMEAQRTNVNNAASEFYKAATAYTNSLNQLKADRLAQTTGFSPSWQIAPQNEIESRMCGEMAWIKTQLDMVAADVAQTKAEVKGYNEGIDAAENAIDFAYMLMGYNDDGSEILYGYWENGEVDVA